MEAVTRGAVARVGRRRGAIGAMLRACRPITAVMHADAVIARAAAG